MNYTEAVGLARQGDERGYTFLYEDTYQSKFYLALKYMKSAEAAEDVLQDSYVKAFSSLDKLANPEAFSGWLGTIVANTAKNALTKKNPTAFSDVTAENDEGDDLEFQIEDTGEEFSPERSYSNQETHELVGELIDSLPDEQRMCVLMYYIEGMPVRDIAASLGCSENTVKSRLRYARQSMEATAQEMQSRGYEFFAGVPALLWLLRSDGTALAAEGVLSAAGKVVAKGVFGSEAVKGAAGAAKAAGGAAKTAAGGAAKAAGHATARKIVAVALATAVVGGGAAYVVTRQSVDTTEQVAVEEVVYLEGSYDFSDGIYFYASLIMNWSGPGECRISLFGMGKTWAQQCSAYYTTSMVTNDDGTVTYMLTPSEEVDTSDYDGCTDKSREYFERYAGGNVVTFIYDPDEETLTSQYGDVWEWRGWSGNT